MRSELNQKMTSLLDILDNNPPPSDLNKNISFVPNILNTPPNILGFLKTTSCNNDKIIDNHIIPNSDVLSIDSTASLDTLKCDNNSNVDQSINEHAIGNGLTLDAVFQHSDLNQNNSNLTMYSDDAMDNASSDLYSDYESGYTVDTSVSNKSFILSRTSFDRNKNSSLTSSVGTGDSVVSNGNASFFRQSCINTGYSSRCDSACINAPLCPVMVRRRTQTDRVSCTDSSTETTSQPVTTACTSTEYIDTADRSTLTTVQTTSDRATTTDYLIVTRDQETFTSSPLLLNISTETERVRAREVGTQHERSGHFNKMTMTRRPIYLERETNTPTIAKYDFEVMTKMSGDDKGTSTRVIITSDRATGYGSVREYENNISGIDRLWLRKEQDRVRNTEAEGLCEDIVSKNSDRFDTVSKNKLDVIDRDKRDSDAGSDPILDEAVDVSCVRCIDVPDVMTNEDHCDSLEWNKIYYASSFSNNKNIDSIDSHNPSIIPVSFDTNQQLINTDIISGSPHTQTGVLGSNRPICPHSLSKIKPSGLVDSKDETEGESRHRENQAVGDRYRYTEECIIDNINKGREDFISGHYQKQTRVIYASRATQTDWKPSSLHTLSSDLEGNADQESVSASLYPSSSLFSFSFLKTDIKQVHSEDCTRLDMCSHEMISTQKLTDNESFNSISFDETRHNKRYSPPDEEFNESHISAQIEKQLFCTAAKGLEIESCNNYTEQSIDDNVPTGKYCCKKEGHPAEVETEIQIDATTNRLMEGRETVLEARLDDALLIQNTVNIGAVPTSASAAVEASKNNNKRSETFDEMTFHHPRPLPLSVHLRPTSASTTPPPPPSLNPPTSSSAPTDLQLLLNSTSADATAHSSCYQQQQQPTCDTAACLPGITALVSVTQSLSASAAPDAIVTSADADMQLKCLQLPVGSSTIEGDLVERTPPQTQPNTANNFSINQFILDTPPTTPSQTNIKDSELCKTIPAHCSSSPVNNLAGIEANLTQSEPSKLTSSIVISSETIGLTEIAANLLKLQKELGQSIQILSQLNKCSDCDSEKILSKVFSAATDALRCIKRCSIKENNQYNKFAHVVDEIKLKLPCISDKEACKTVGQNLVHDAETSTLITSVTCGTNTPRVYRVDAGVETRPISTVDNATSMARAPSYIDKETCTPTIHHIHKNVATHNEPMVDKYTEMSVDVTAAYRMGTLLSCTPSVFVSRGTLTSHPITADRSTFVRGHIDLEGFVERACSPVRAFDREVMVDRASSPVRPVCFDKSVMATKGEALEPVDRYQSVGKVSGSKILRPLMELRRISKPRLDSISESLADDELNEEEEEEEADNIVERMKGSYNCDITVSYSSNCIKGDRVLLNSQDMKRKASFSRSTVADMKINRRLDRVKFNLMPVSPRPVRLPLQSGAGCVFDFDSQES